MDTNQLQTILNNPEFVNITRKKFNFSILLTIITCVIYFGFILLIAFSPATLGNPINQNSVISIGLIIGVLIILISILITGLYVWRCNTVYDPITNNIIEKRQYE